MASISTPACRVAWWWAPCLALEAVHGASLGDDGTSVDGVTVKGEVDLTPGFCLKPKYAVGSGVVFLARMGNADSKIKLEGASMGLSAPDRASSFRLGLCLVRCAAGRGIQAGLKRNTDAA